MRWSKNYKQMTKQETITQISHAIAEGNLSKAEDALDGYASVQCAECENSRNNLIIDLAGKCKEIENMTAAWDFADKARVEWAEMCIKKQAIIEAKEEAIKELVEGLRSNDETLSYLEDFTHGYEGHKITQQRGENQKLIQKHKQ